MQLVDDSSNYLMQLASFVFLALLLTWWASKTKFFASLKNPDFAPGATHQNFKKVKWYHLLTGFAALIFVQGLLPALASAIFPKLASDPVAYGWMVVTVNVLFSLILIYYLKFENLKGIVYNKHTYIKEGLLTLAIALPWVLLASLLAHGLVVDWLGQPPVEQNPVTFLQSFDLSMPVFYAVALAIFTVIPINEEILFRGLFQNFITKHSNKWGGLIITPLFFTLVHFQFGQGLSNIELLTPLFILSFFLSYLYQKTGSLFATTAFHMLFNFLTTFGLFFEKLGFFVK